MDKKALEAAREQLKYWQDKKVREIGDAKRIEQCERFIKQCETVIAALEQAAKSARTDGAPSISRKGA